MKRKEDRSRAELITRFHCAECGGQLTCSYDDHPSAGNYLPGDQSGAYVRYNGIAIWPCISCIEAKTRDGRKLAEAFSSLVQAEISKG